MSNPNNLKDQSGNIYQSNTGKPATYGENVKIVTPNGLVPGQMLGGSVVKK